MNRMLRARIEAALPVLVTLFLLVDGGVTLLRPEMIAPEMVSTGWPLWTAPIIGAIPVVAALVYAIPRTAIIGAILATGFLGGAIATHLRLGEIGSPPQLVSLALGIAAWAALVLRGRVSGMGTAPEPVRQHA